MGLLLTLALLAGVVTGCGSDTGSGSGSDRVVIKAGNGDFNPAEIYEKAAPAVVTVLSIFGQSGAGPGAAGQGSGFLISNDGEILTNAHVVTTGGEGNGGGELVQAERVYVELSDRNRADAEVIGFDADADVALLKIDPADADAADVEPLDLSSRDAYAVGEPVAAIGSPFGERQSLSIGVISATDRSIDSLSEFAINGAIQTDASINPGNSGGPLLDSNADVIGINQQIETNSGSNSGVGFAIPVAAINYSLDQLRSSGEVRYAYLGVSTQGLWPQLADELGIDSDSGALVGEVSPGSAAADAGIKGGNERITFQGSPIQTGGDVIVSVDGKKVVSESDLSRLIGLHKPGETITLEIIRDGERREVDVELDERPGP